MKYLAVFVCALGLAPSTVAQSNSIGNIYTSCVASFDQDAKQDFEPLKNRLGLMLYSDLMRTHSSYTFAACECTRDTVAPTLSRQDRSRAVRYFKDNRSLRTFSDREVIDFNRTLNAFNVCFDRADRETGLMLKLQDVLQAAQRR